LRRALLRPSDARFRVVEFSVQRDHVHLIAEADDASAFSSGMRSLTTRLAHATNRALGRRAGRVWGDRYHTRALSSPRAVRNALVYVLANARKHLGSAAPRIDPCSSASSFDGFEEKHAPMEPNRAETWLLRVGWRRHGAIALHEAPRSSNRPPSRR
jgi:hypothetical protein